MGLFLALSGFIIVVGAAIQYFMTIAKETVPAEVQVHVLLFGGGTLIALMGALLAPNAVTITLAIFAAAIGIFLLWLLVQRRVPDGELIVGIGDLMPALVAPNQDGELVDIADLRGQRIMFKFFRGSW